MSLDLLHYLPNPVAGRPPRRIGVHDSLQDVAQLRVIAGLREALPCPRLALSIRRASPCLALGYRRGSKALGRSAEEPIDMRPKVRRVGPELRCRPSVERQRARVPGAPGLGLVTLVAVGEACRTVDPEE